MLKNYIGNVSANNQTIKINSNINELKNRNGSVNYVNVKIFERNNLICN